MCHLILPLEASTASMPLPRSRSLTVLPGAQSAWKPANPLPWEAQGGSRLVAPLFNDHGLAGLKVKCCLVKRAQHFWDVALNKTFGVPVSQP